MSGNAITVQWESTDKAVLDWLSSQTKKNSTPTSNVAITSTPTQTSSSHHGISAGAIAGIAIGAVAGLAFLILGVWLLLRRRKRNQPVVNPERGSLDAPTYIAPEKGIPSPSLTSHTQSSKTNTNRLLYWHPDPKPPRTRHRIHLAHRLSRLVSALSLSQLTMDEGIECSRER